MTKKARQTMTKIKNFFRLHVNNEQKIFSNILFHKQNQSEIVSLKERVTHGLHFPKLWTGHT